MVWFNVFHHKFDRLMGKPRVAILPPILMNMVCLVGSDCQVGLGFANGVSRSLSDVARHGYDLLKQLLN